MTSIDHCFGRCCSPSQPAATDLDCALEISDGGATRIGQIVDLICACDHTIHDISNVELDAQGNLPRFNMPLEFGIDIGLRLKHPDAASKRALILEKERHRYDRFLSDTS